MSTAGIISVSLFWGILFYNILDKERSFIGTPYLKSFLPNK